MDNMLSLERLSALDAEQAKLDERGSVLHPRLFGKPNGDAISVQLRKRFTHVTRRPAKVAASESRAGRQVASARWRTKHRTRPRRARAIPASGLACHRKVAGRWRAGGHGSVP